MPEQLRLRLANSVHNEVLVDCVAEATEVVERGNRLAAPLLKYNSTYPDCEHDAVVSSWSRAKELYAHVAVPG